MGSKLGDLGKEEELNRHLVGHSKAAGSEEAEAMVAEQSFEAQTHHRQVEEEEAMRQKLKDKTRLPKDDGQLSLEDSVNNRNAKTNNRMAVRV